MSDFLQSGAIMSLSSNKYLIGWGNYEYLNGETPDSNKPLFYLNDFFLTKSSPWIQFNHTTEMDGEELNKRLAEIPVSYNKPLWKNSSKSKFKENFDGLFKLLKSGTLTKAVPYLFIHSSNEVCVAQVLKKGIKAIQERHGYLYGVWNQQEGVLGLTPEILFSCNHKNPTLAQTMALAGTCSSKQDLDIFMTNHKERLEHQIVIEGICHSIKDIGEAIPGNLKVLQLPILHHLMTWIEIQLKDSFNFDLMVKKLHPTPALGAFPKIQGKEWLVNFQMHTPRGYYGAPIGFYDPKNGVSSCFVGIRNVQWNPTGMRIGAGCGVVEESVFENEWNEIHLKIHSIKEQFDL